MSQFSTVDVFVVIMALMSFATSIWRASKSGLLETRESITERRLRTLDLTIETLNRLIAEKQLEIDKLKKELEETKLRLKKLEDRYQNSRTQGLLLALIGEDPMLQADLAALRKVQDRVKLKFVRLLPVTKTLLERTLEQHRKNRTPVAYVHCALHSSPEGLEFADGVASGVWLSAILRGVKVMVIAGCSSTSVGELIGVVPAVITFMEDISNSDAAIFTEVFWTEIGLGAPVGEAFETALQLSPPVLSEYAQLHQWSQDAN